MFGEMAFLDSSPRSTRVTAHGSTRLLKLSKSKLDITSIYNKIVKNIALIGIHRLRLTNQKFISDKQKIG
jgi:CRP-like cAMP-binding protein